MVGQPLVSPIPPRFCARPVLSAASSVTPLLRAGRGDAGKSAADTADRRVVRRMPVLRQPADDGPADPAVRAGQRQAGASTHAAHGPGGDRSQSPAWAHATEGHRIDPYLPRGLTIVR